MILRLLPIFLTVLFFLVSCGKVFHTPDKPKDKPYLMVRGFTVPGKPFTMKVGRFNPGSDKARVVKPAADASVTVSLKDAPKKQLKPVGDGFFRSDGWKPRAGKQYQVEVAHPTIQTLKAKAYLPRPIRLSIDGLKVVKRLDKGDPMLYHMKLEWEDPPNDTNYYEIRAQALILDEKGQVKGQPNVTLLASNPGYQKMETKGLLISDRNLQGPDVSIPIYLDARFDIEGKLAGFRVELRHVNKAYFDNRQSLPPLLPSQPTSKLFKSSKNVEEGLGYIAGYSTSIASVGAY